MFEQIFDPPPMAGGTEKQIAWATKIRQRMMDEMYAHAARAADKAANAGNHPTPQREQEISRMLAWVEGRDAQWWIENRARGARELFILARP